VHTLNISARKGYFLRAVETSRRMTSYQKEAATAENLPSQKRKANELTDVATRTATAGTGAVDPSLIGATSSAAPAGYAGTDRFQPSGTDRNSSGGGNSTAGAIGAGGAHYYLSGGKKIAVQT